MTILGPGAAVVAIDVGGTDLKAAIVDQDGAVLDVQRHATARSADDPAGAVIAQTVEIVKSLRAAHPEIPVAAVGLAVPGLVDDAAGVGRFSANLGWRDVPFATRLATQLDVPVWFGHDVRAAGVAEFAYGAARGARNAAVIVIGTGIAGALIVNGTPLTSEGYAGELGHTLADPNGEACSCGAVGCLETISSAGAIARRYNARTDSAVAGARQVLTAAQSGDVVARQVWDSAVSALAEHIARLSSVLAPDTIVIGGGLAQAGDDLFAPLMQQVDALLSFHRRPKIVAAELGEDAGVLGVAAGARSRATA